MTFRVTITIPGEPFVKRAPRWGRVGKGDKARPMAFAHPETAKNERTVKQFAVEAMEAAGYDKPFGGPVAVKIAAYRSKGLKSMSKRRREAALADEVRPTTRPDTDNHSKAVLDGINGVCFLDDAQVVAELIVKMYSDRPRIEVTITEWQPRTGPTAAEMAAKLRRKVARWRDTADTESERLAYELVLEQMEVEGL